MQIAVIGMHRSGTSVLARLLNLLGIYFAPEGMGTGANQENPKGFWERRDVRALNDHVLHSVGCDWNRVSRLDLDSIPAPLAAEFEKRAAQIVLSMDANRPWFIKEPRLCVLLPLWRRVLETPICIHILRHPVEVASSLKTRNGIPLPAGLALWEYYNRSALASMRDLPRITVGHRDLIQKPSEALSSIKEQLESFGVGRLTFPDGREIESFVSGELYREREGERGLDAFSDSPQVKIFERWLSGKSLPKADRGQPQGGLKALEEYEAGLPPLNVPSQPKKPTEAELKAQVASRERDMKLAEERLVAVKSELEQRDLRLAFLEGEFTALRENSSSREQVASGFVAELRQMLVERDVWLQDKDKTVELDRARFQDDIARMSEKVESLRLASAAAERALVLKVDGFELERKEWQQQLVSESERMSGEFESVKLALAVAEREFALKESAFAEERKQWQQRLVSESGHMSEKLESLKHALSVAEREFSRREIGFSEDRKELQRKLDLESARLLEREQLSASKLAEMEAKIKAAAEASQRERVQLAEEKDRLMVELREVTAELAKSRGDAAHLLDELHGTTLRMAQIEEEKNQLSDSLQETLSKLGQADVEVNRLCHSIEEGRHDLAMALRASDGFRAQAAERSAEIEQLTRLYLDRQGEIDRLTTLQGRTEADNASARASFQARESVLRGDVTLLSKRLASLEQQLASLEQLLASEQAAAAQIRASSQAERALCRNAITFYGNEIERMDSMMTAIRSSSSWKAMAVARRLRAWLGGGSASAGHEIGSAVALLRQSRWFDADWYVAKYDDVLPSGLAPEVHFLVHGGIDVRDPSPEFDTRFYLASNPDVSASGQNPLLHFIRHGEAEGRPAKSVAD